MVFNGVFGIHYTPGGIVFSPTLPAGWGDATLSGFSYRKAAFTVRLHSSGNQIRAFSLDGRPQNQPLFPATLTGAHTVDITLGGRP
jgi:cellobiose phosphorylase